MRRVFVNVPLSLIALTALTGGCTAQSPAQPALTSGQALPAGGDSATALRANIDPVRIHNPLTFTLANCPDLPGLTIVGSGDEFLVMNFRTDQNGVTYIERNDLVTGSATDNHGATYRFNYHNHSNIQTPSTGFPWSFTTTDHFNLVGNGKADQMQVSFVARVTFASAGAPPQAEFVHVHGNPLFCDPI